MATKKGKTKPRGTAPLPVRAIAVTVGAAAAAVAAAAFWVLPTLSHVSDIRAETDSVEQSTVNAQDRIDRLESGESSGAQAKLTEALRLDEQLPAEIDKATLAAQIQTRAASYGLTVNKLAPVDDADKKSGALSALVFDMSVEGSDSQALSFVEELTEDGQSARLMTVDGVTLAVNEGKATMTFTLSAYFSTEPALQASS